MASEKRGGNAMGLTASDPDRFVLEIAGIYQKAEDDKKVQDMGKEFTDLLLAESKAAQVSFEEASRPWM